MQSIESMPARAELRAYVRAYARRKMQLPDVPLICPVPARLEPVLEFQFGDSFEICFGAARGFFSPRIAVMGVQTEFRARAMFHGTIDSFGIFFQPAGISQLFGVPMRVLHNGAFDATSVLGCKLRALWDQLGQTDDFQSRVAITEQFLLAVRSGARFHDPMLEISNRMLVLQGRFAITGFAREAGMGIRHLERRFTGETGVAPKHYARVARFQTALDRKVSSPFTSWLQIAHDLGYYDQMHLIHDFKRLGGDSPGRLLEHLGDMRPDAVAAQCLIDRK